MARRAEARAEEEAGAEATIAEPMPSEPEVVAEEMPAEAPVVESIAVEAPMIAERFPMETPMVAKIAPVPVSPRTQIAVELAVIPSHAAMKAPMVTDLGELHLGAGGPGPVRASLRFGGCGGEREHRKRGRGCKQQLSHLAYSQKRAGTARAVKTRQEA